MASGGELKRGVATAQKIEIDSLAARLNEERLASGSTHVLDMMFGAWTRKDG